MTEHRHDEGHSEATEWPSELETGMPEARRRITRWPGWIWAIPLAALIFVVWLGLKSWLLAAPTVTVTFDSAEGISMGTPVRHKGVQVGRVDAVQLDPSLGKVELTLVIEGHMTGHLREGTEFWIVRPSLGGGAITELLAGAYIAMTPGEGEERRRFKGRREAPILAPSTPGRDFVLQVGDGGGVSAGAPVRYRGIEVGRVLGNRYRDDQGRVDVRIFVRKPYAERVREATVFWRAGGFSVGTSASGLSVELPAPKTLLSGAVEFATPAVAAGSRAANSSRFTLHDTRAEALAEPAGPRVAYRVRLPGITGGLRRGAPVTLEGRQVGRVQRTGISIDAASGELTTPVVITLNAARFGLDLGTASSQDALRARLDTQLRQLTANGLRARAGGLSLLGGQQVELVMLDDDAGAMRDVEGGLPRLPAAPDAPGPSEAIAALSRLGERWNQVPIAAIGANLRATSESLKQLTATPELEASLRAFAATAENLEAVTASAEARTDQILASLERTAAAAESATQAIDRLSGGAVRQNRDLADLVAELTDTARAVQELARYLTRHPEALLRGREGEE